VWCHSKGLELNPGMTAIQVTKREKRSALSWRRSSKSVVSAAGSAVLICDDGTGHPLYDK
jgi:hypothetical protein